MPTVTTFSALLSGYTWNGIQVPGRPTFLTYSFDTGAAATFRGAFPDAFLNSFQAFTAAEQATARLALQAWADISGLTLFEVPPGQGDIRFGVYDFRLAPEEFEDNSGFAYTPYVFNYPGGAGEEDFGGDIFIDIGQTDFETLAHEIGHALGLKHPFEGSTTLDKSVDDLAHTVMTYNNVGGPATTIGTLDVEAIQFMYGPNSADGTQAASWSWDAQAFRLTQAGSAGADSLAGVEVQDRITGGAGNDYVFTRAGADTVEGGDGDDTLAGGAGADLLDGATGDDEIDGDDGDDIITGGDGNDELDGFAGADTVDGGAGDDTVVGDSGNDRLLGGDGDDEIFADGGRDTLIGGAGNDVIVIDNGSGLVDGGDGYDELWLSPFSSASAVLNYAGLTAGGGSFTGIEAIGMVGANNADTLQGGDLPDFLFGGGGQDSLSGGASDDYLFGDTGADTLSGGGGADILESWSGDDVILSSGGADSIYAGTGSDTVDFSGELEAVTAIVNGPRFIDGGAARQLMFDVENLVGSAFGDNLVGDAGANRLFGGGGADTVGGGDGANYLRGDDGNDSLVGGVNFDDINGNMGDDTASGGLGDDWVVGGKDQDRLSGGDGGDLVYGNIGSDTCDGGAGNDTIRGGQNEDVLTGGEGADFLSGDRDADTMTGGAGADIFHTFGESAVDRVTDFSLAEGDRVMLDPGTQFSVAQSGADTVINMTGGGQMILVGVQMSTLTGSWIFGA